ncbi:hypothetical protein JTE90_025828 [Oedothorax gibbosus]|uniref:Uncharacterized protein n=1 Tax=Oedothorax gibbosus TaxID=931172 RepID=A0AAV6UWE8_9ARAC|nr:hypothetical protein JTE90_025828 [Oedothorax gibbosus]
MDVWVENRSAVIQCLSRAVTLDHSGDCEAAFGKYLESLNALSLYLKEMHVALGFHKTVEKHCEITRVLSMIRECTDRVQIIVDTNSANSTKVVTVRRREENSRRDSISNDVVTPPSQKFPPFEKLQADNMRIIKQYQWRCERTNNYREKTNIRLELERKLAENAVIAKQKYNTVSFNR